LLRISRMTKSLPPDLAENHDHYLHLSGCHFTGRGRYSK
jgi:hypothetical protein